MIPDTYDVVLVKLSRSWYSYEHESNVSTIVQGLTNDWSTISRDDYMDLCRWITHKNNLYLNDVYLIVTRQTKDEVKETLASAIAEAKKERLAQEAAKKKREKAKLARQIAAGKAKEEAEKKLFEKLQKKFAKKE